MLYRRFTIITLLLLGIGFLGASVLNEGYRNSHHASLTSFGTPNNAPQSPVDFQNSQPLAIKPVSTPASPDTSSSSLNTADM